MVLSRLAFIVFFSVLGAGVVLAQDATYTVKPGDILKVSVWKEPDLQGPIRWILVSFGRRS